MNPEELTAHEIHRLFENKKITSTEITEALQRRIENTDKKVKAFVALTPQLALKNAGLADERIKKGEKLSPLEGVPVAIKDNMCTKDAVTTASSKILKNYFPPYNATVVNNLEAVGAVTIGKTNLDEFAMGSSTENSGFFETRNPWNTDHVPGGSSGGSAAAVAAGEAIVALGSDTGGSIRQPASFCGVVGLKPTYGRVSRYGLIAFASSLDQIGPLTKDVEDAAIMMNIISGFDPKDSTSVNRPVPDFRKSMVADVKGLKIGLIKQLMGKGIEADIKESVKQAVKKLEELGAKIEDVSLPTFEYAVATYYIIAPAEASSNLARYDAVKYGHRAEGAQDLLSMYHETRREGFGPEVKRRIMIGTYALSSGYYDAYYLKAQKVRTLILKDFEKAFEKFDVLISPTTPTTAFKVGEKSDDPLSMYLSDIATIPVNLAGLPAISIPCGFSKGLPIGLQIIGKAFDEETILKTAYTYEQNTEWHKKKPNVK